MRSTLKTNLGTVRASFCQTAKLATTNELQVDVAAQNRVKLHLDLAAKQAHQAHESAAKHDKRARLGHTGGGQISNWSPVGISEFLAFQVQVYTPSPPKISVETGVGVQSGHTRATEGDGDVI